MIPAARSFHLAFYRDPLVFIVVPLFFFSLFMLHLPRNSDQAECPFAIIDVAPCIAASQLQRRLANGSL